MLTTTPRSIRATTLLVTLALASCSAPISFQKIACKTPAGQFNVSPLSEALRELEAGKTARDPMVASGHFFECARLAGNLALAGESGALALYNQATGLLVELLDENKSLPWGRTITIGSGNASYTLHGKQEPGAPAGDRRYVNVDSLKFDGVYSSIRATRPGVGAPLVAISGKNNDFRKTYETQELHKALTAVLRFDGNKSATLELHDPLDTERISIAGRNPQLAADFSAPVSMLMSVARPDKLGLIRLLNPQKYSDTARLTRLQEYDPKRTPVLFVHGLDSTPATWTLMYHSLMQDPAIRKNYQFWAFSYPSGYPYFYSASLLRKELDGVKHAFPASKEMIIVGHSMGGMISRLMVTDANDSNLALDVRNTARADPCPRCQPPTARRLRGIRQPRGNRHRHLHRRAAPWIGIVQQLHRPHVLQTRPHAHLPHGRPQRRGLRRHRGCRLAPTRPRAQQHRHTLS